VSLSIHLSPLSAAAFWSHGEASDKRTQFQAKLREEKTSMFTAGWIKVSVASQPIMNRLVTRR
jgi:hypothetical protein